MRLFATIFVFLTMLTGAVNADVGRLPDVDIGMLPKDGQFKFMVDEVPNSITLYWDYNFDNKADAIIACPMLGYGRLPDCKTPLRAEKNEYIFTNCPSSEPLYYITTRHCWECLSCRMWIQPDKAMHPRSIDLLTKKCVQKN